MSDWQIVSRRQHAEYGWLPRQGFYFASELNWLPIALAELPKLPGEYVIALAGEREAPEPVVLTDIGLGRNLYVDAQGRWLSHYVPAELRAYPFGMVDNADGKPALGIRSEHLVAAGEEGARPLFDAEGNPSADVAGVSEFLKQRERQRVQTRKAAQLLVELELVVPWPLKVRLEAGAEPEVLPGLWRIDHNALAALSGEALARLNAAGVLPLAALQPIDRRAPPTTARAGKIYRPARGRRGPRRNPREPGCVFLCKR
ncbi:MAG: SapC family protein [Halomonas sp.]|uniref:SapC family protein n=1 Tax=Halomonas sp. TaxID=1486246 RepID=UPI002ACE8790|nr:SapC family protein [Halomonas sp.]MDZ7853750.1 SapC family protein [Halomonas sp.]